jgi:hypothetical protein
LGLIGTGTLAVPVLAASCAYAIAEGASWKSSSLNLKPSLAGKFYAVIAVAIVVGLAPDFAGLNAVKMLFWSAILNGLLSPTASHYCRSAFERPKGNRQSGKLTRHAGIGVGLRCHHECGGNWLAGSPAMRTPSNSLPSSARGCGDYNLKRRSLETSAVSNGSGRSKNTFAPENEPTCDTAHFSRRGDAIILRP